MPKDSKIIRPPSFRAKLNQIKGLAPEEKALMQRIGALIDTFAINQKQISNPRSRRRTLSSAVPIPQNVNATGITGGVQVTWDEVDGQIDFYEIQFSESVTFAVAETFQVIGTRMSFRSLPASGTLFVRLRTVTKQGNVSLYTNTLSLTVSGASVFSADFDHIEPENRTTVSPKPTLLGRELNLTGSGEKAFVGVGTYLGPSPLTINDGHPGFSANSNIRNEVTYTVYEDSSPFPGIEQHLAPTIGEYIDHDGFYTYTPQFYSRFAILPNSIADFFEVIDLTADPSELDIEFLRYRIINSFYNPDFNQAGISISASMANIKF